MARAIDHLVLCVRDLDAARASYRAMGFALAPVGVHPFGTRNSLVQLAGRNFLELLAIGDESAIPPQAPRRFSFAAFNRDFLRARGEGMSMLVFASEDARVDAAQFAAQGLADFEPFDFGRDAKLPNGTVARVAFSLAFVARSDMPGAVFFACQQRHPPELFWKSEYQAHPNGAKRAVSVTMSAARPADWSDFFARLTGGPVAATGAGGILAGPESDRIALLSPNEYARRFPGAPLDGDESPRFRAFRLLVDDLAAARRALEAGGVPHRAGPETILVPPSAAHGVAIEFAAG